MSSPSGGLGEGNNARKALPQKRKRRSGRSGKGKKQTTEGLGIGSCFVGLDANIPDGFVTGDRVFVRLKDTGKEIYNDIAERDYGEWLDVGFNGVLTDRRQGS